MSQIITFSRFFEILRKSLWWQEICFENESEEQKVALKILESFSIVPAPGISKSISLDLACFIAGEGGRTIFELGKEAGRKEISKDLNEEWEEMITTTAGWAGIPTLK